MNLKEYGSDHDIIQGTIPAFAWRDRKTTKKTSVRISTVSAVI
jgi:hypothetical protein